MRGRLAASLLIYYVAALLSVERPDLYRDDDDGYAYIYELEKRLGEVCRSIASPDSLCEDLARTYREEVYWGARSNALVHAEDIRSIANTLAARAARELGVRLKRIPYWGPPSPEESHELIESALLAVELAEKLAGIPMSALKVRALKAREKVPVTS